MAFLFVITLAFYAGNTSFAEEKATKTSSVEAMSDTALWTPFQLSLFCPIQLYNYNYAVKGIRTGLIYSDNHYISGIDFGAVNFSETMEGLQVGLANDTSKEGWGLQAAVFGCKAEKFTGMQVGFLFSAVERTMRGAQFSILTNITTQERTVETYPAKVEGIQAAALYNKADVCEGVQIGILNSCHRLKGVQIGLINICEKQSFPFTSIINIRF